jgi:phosphoribosylaminoimidazole-succinocarboxamide synthase
MNDAVTQTSLPFPLFQRGKVRDVYDLGDQLLVVSTDRISAFDVVLPTGVPQKGRVLNQMSAFWFLQTAGIIDNHMVESIDTAESLAGLSHRLGQHDALPAYLIGRCMVAKKAHRIPVECVIRGYLSGSAWAEYRAHGTVQGKPMPAGMRESDALGVPLFTPTTKSEIEHDRPLTERDIEELEIRDTMPALENASLALYSYAAAYARERGIIIADTKFEFGWLNGTIILIDEALTPDSSRFWAVDDYVPGRAQPSYDKQPVRDWLADSGWNDNLPAPPLPPGVVAETSARYIKVFEWLTKSPA